MWINCCCCCWVTTQERDFIAFTAGLPISISATRPSFLYTYRFLFISCHFLFKNKQTRKKKREVSQLIKSQVSPGNQTSNLLKKIKEGRALTDSRLSRLCVSTSTFSGIPPSPSATPHPQPPPGSSSCQEMKNKNYIFGRFDVRLTSLSSQKISVSCCLLRRINAK